MVGSQDPMDDVLPLLRCPTHAHAHGHRGDGADARLVAHARGLECRPGPHRFPTVAGIPCLFEDPHKELAQWRYQVEDFLRDNDATADTVLAMIAGASLHPRTHQRLQKLHAALLEHGRRVSDLMAVAGVEASTRQERDHRKRVPGEGTLTAYYHQIHRDWGWSSGETDENRAALEALLQAVDPDCPPRKMLAIGAGACRLPYDLHLHLRPDITVALDLNPLPFVVAREVIEGRSVKLFEFPITPRSGEHIAVERELRAQRPGATGFHFLFADGLRPPVADGSFDTVLTPWFIDQVPKNMVESFAEIRRVLPDGGVWLNHGPLIYHPSHTMLAHRYPVDEVLDLVRDAGFEIEHHRFERTLYMQSPAGSQGRTETVLTFRARKVKATRGEAPDERPPWLDDSALPVPKIEAGGYRPPHPMFAAVLGLVDGRRSTKDIADEMIRKHNLPTHAALGGVQACLAEIWRATRPESAESSKS